jgi:hypothetical protein
MRTDKDMRVLESVARGNPQFREILQTELDAKVKLLVGAVDVEQMRRAQGHAQCLQNLIDMLDLSLAPRRA